MKRFLVVAAILIVMLPSCSWFKETVKAGTKALIDCEKEDLSRLVTEDGATLLGQAITVLQTRGDGWRDALTSLGTKVGEGALACAVEAARVGADAVRFQIAPTDVASRAATYIVERGWQFKE